MSEDKSDIDALREQTKLLKDRVEALLKIANILARHVKPDEYIGISSEP